MGYRFVCEHRNEYTEEYEVGNQSPEWLRQAYCSSNLLLPELPPEIFLSWKEGYQHNGFLGKVRGSGMCYFYIKAFKR